MVHARIGGNVQFLPSPLLTIVALLSAIDQHMGPWGGIIDALFLLSKATLQLNAIHKKTDLFPVTPSAFLVFSNYRVRQCFLVLICQTMYFGIFYTLFSLPSPGLPFGLGLTPSILALPTHFNTVSFFLPLSFESIPFYLHSPSERISLLLPPSPFRYGPPSNCIPHLHHVPDPSGRPSCISGNLIFGVHSRPPHLQRGYSCKIRH
jgi:hypothetical protein